MDNKDPFLNETGRINMGDLSKFNPNAPVSNVVQIFGADGRVKTANTEEEEQKRLAQAEAMVKAMTPQSGIVWHKDDDESEKRGKDMFFPQLMIKGLSEKFGVSRPHKEFFPNERNLLITAFMNDCAEYLFGVPAFNEVHTKNGVAFRPNKDWEKLPVVK